MKYLFLSLCTLLMLTSCNSQSKVATSFQSFKSKFFATADEKQLEKVIASLREGNTERAEHEIYEIGSPFTRSQGLGKLIHFQIVEKNDLIAAKKAVEKLALVIDEIPAKEDKLFSQVELADFLHYIDKDRSKEMLKQIETDTWLIVSPEERSRVLIRMISLQLETQQDAVKAKTTIEQTRQTIDFIQKDSLKHQRTRELENVLFVNNHILCKQL